MMIIITGCFFIIDRLSCTDLVFVWKRYSITIEISKERNDEIYSANDEKRFNCQIRQTDRRAEKIYVLVVSIDISYYAWV